MSRDVSALPCPNCGKQPEVLEVGYVDRGVCDGYSLTYYKLMCRRWWHGWWGACFSPCRRKAVSNGDPWYRWREDLTEEWNSECLRLMQMQSKAGSKHE